MQLPVTAQRPRLLRGPSSTSRPAVECAPQISEPSAPAGAAVDPHERLVGVAVRPTSTLRPADRPVAGVADPKRPRRTGRSPGKLLHAHARVACVRVRPSLDALGVRAAAHHRRSAVAQSLERVTEGPKRALRVPGRARRSRRGRRRRCGGRARRHRVGAATRSAGSRRLAAARQQDDARSSRQPGRHRAAPAQVEQRAGEQPGSCRATRAAAAAGSSAPPSGIPTARAAPGGSVAASAYSTAAISAERASAGAAAVKVAYQGIPSTRPMTTPSRASDTVFSATWTRPPR